MGDNKVEKIAASYYCRLALLLCQQARYLHESSEPEKAAKFCRLISTLCATNDYEQCKEESKLCLKVAEKCISPTEVTDAKSICEMARKVCPKSFNLRGS